MLNKTLLLSVGAGLVIVGALISGGLFVSRGAHLTLEGGIIKVRTAPIEADRSVIVIDYRATNPSDYPFQMKDVLIEVTEGGEVLEGRHVPETDTAILFQGLPQLGQKFNTALRLKERIAAHQTRDAMAAFTFDVPVARLDKREKLVLRIHEVDGPKVEFVEKPRP